MKKQLAYHHVVPNSTSGSNEDEEEEEQSIDGQSGTSFESTSTAAIFLRLPRWVTNLLRWWKCTGCCASMAAKSHSMGCARHPAQMHFLLNPPSASINLLLLCPQDAPSAVSTAVEAPGLEEPDPLQQEVDPKLLVSSICMGPAWCRHNPTQMHAGVRVDVHHIFCAWCELADSVDTHTLCAETLCVSTASTGDGAAGTQKSSFYLADCQPLSTADFGPKARNKIKLSFVSEIFRIILLGISQNCLRNF
jgi:hypothetical protein